MQAYCKPSRNAVKVALRAVVNACTRTGRKPAPVALPAARAVVRRNHRR